jgi:7-cyano-7-deazaguanine synthase
MTKRKLRDLAVVAFSGGQDSTTCLFWALHRGFDVHALTIFYGQRHSIELHAAAMVIEYAKHCYPDCRITHEIVNLPEGILQGTSPLVSGAELEQYKDHHSLPGGLEKTFVPMRNQLFMTIAANRAFVMYPREIEEPCPVLITGVCEEDFGGYPDCRGVFLQALGEACDLGTFTAEAGFPNGLQIVAPLLKLSKAQTVDLAHQTPGCYSALALTHTAYDGAYPPRGHDHANLLRQKGFAEAALPDPLIVRAWADGLLTDGELPDQPGYEDKAALKRLAEILPRRRHV